MTDFRTPGQANEGSGYLPRFIHRSGAATVIEPGILKNSMYAVESVGYTLGLLVYRLGRDRVGLDKEYRLLVPISGPGYGKFLACYVRGTLI